MTSGTILAFRGTDPTAGWWQNPRPGGSWSWLTVSHLLYFLTHHSSYTKCRDILSLTYVHKWTYMVLKATKHVRATFSKREQPRATPPRFRRDSEDNSYFLFVFSTCTFLSTFLLPLQARNVISKLFLSVITSETHTRLWKLMSEFRKCTWKREKYQQRILMQTKHNSSESNFKRFLVLMANHWRVSTKNLRRRRIMSFGFPGFTLKRGKV